MNAAFYPFELIFKQASGTSRGILHTKKTYFLKLTYQNKSSIGECPYFEGLSNENQVEVEKKLAWLCENLHLNKSEIEQELVDFPCIQFGFEQAILGLKSSQENTIYFPSEFTNGTKGIQINGLIWMGTIDFMQEQIKSKLAQGFKCLKLKIGTNWQEEKEIIQKLRAKFPKNILEIRVDANGAFDFEKALNVLEDLKNLQVHSIEQPIKKNQFEEMKKLCKENILPIALDEELIGVNDFKKKEELLKYIKPNYLIFKPSLIGGIKGTLEWIELCEKHQTNWWITSALESNIGLNFLAQWTFTLKNELPQGLGTGGLFSNNFKTNLKIIGQELWLNPK